jgi:hypothetical protein
MRPQSKEYPVKRFLPISRNDSVVQLSVGLSKIIVIDYR